MILYIIFCSLLYNWTDRIMLLREFQYQRTRICSLVTCLVLHKFFFFFFYIQLWICFYFLKRATFLCVFVLALFVVTFDAKGFPFLPVLHKIITYIFIKSSLYSIKKKKLAQLSTFLSLIQPPIFGW